MTKRTLSGLVNLTEEPLGKCAKSLKISDEVKDIKEVDVHSKSHNLQDPDDECTHLKLLLKQIDLPRDFSVNSTSARKKAIFYRQAYRMTPKQFWGLCRLLSRHMKSDYKKSEVPFRISAVLRHFAGGDSLKEHSITEVELEEYITEVVEAIEDCNELDVKFPLTHQEQQMTAAAFEMIRSDVGFDCCAGIIGSMLVWTQESIKQESSDYWCERQKRHGIHFQAICDHNGRFLDMSFAKSGLVDDLDAFRQSEIGKKMMEKDFLAPGLMLFGGKAYSSSPAVVTPVCDVKDDDKLAKEFNYHHGQLTRHVDIAFASLLERWGLLRRPLPSSYETDKQIGLVSALLKLHNFCLTDVEPLLRPLASDLVYGYMNGAILLENNGTSSELTYTSPKTSPVPPAHEVVLEQQARLQKMIRVPNMSAGPATS